MPHIFYARDRQMRAERPSLGLEPERLQPAHDFLLQMPERLGSIGQTNPDHARWARRGKYATPPETQSKRPLRERLAEGRGERVRGSILDLPDEHERQMKIVEHDPARVQTGSPHLLPQVVGSARRGRTHCFIELDGDKEAHQAIIRLTRSSAACVDWNFTMSRPPRNE